MVGMPILMTLASARATHGAANVTAPVPISAKVERRLKPGLWVLVIFPSLVGFVRSIPFVEIVSSPTFKDFRAKGGDVKPNMNYESEFITVENDSLRQ
jgi:hypothetical protein